MVARPPLRLRIEPMRLEDVPDVHRIESASFPTPWPDYAFKQEIQTNRLAHYLVVRAGDETIGYGGLWLMVDEAHITTFAVLPEWRRRGVGGRLMVEMMRLASDLNARVVTLEVRLSNHAARSLYARFGFKPVGIRPRYYSDNNEDALIMTTAPIATPEMRERLAELEQQYGDGDFGDAQ
jgi:ribosomal-protein-alanine N-acetyltransferase